MNDYAATVHRYDELWAEHDAASRRAILSEIWAEDGVYVDPEVPGGVHGREALSDFVATSHDEMPGLDIRATSPLVVLGERGWYAGTRRRQTGRRLTASTSSSSRTTVASSG